MSHLDAGAIATLRDGGLVPEETRSHAASCPVCRQALDEAEARRGRVHDALRSLDPVGPQDLDAAKAAVRLRLDRRRAAVHRRPLLPFSGALGRAAAILLLAAGVVYALPGSPLRSWVTGENAVEPTATLAAPEEGGAEGIRVPVPVSGLTVALLDVSPSTRVEVVWVDGEQATVAPGPGARYAVSEGRAQARISAGPVRLELPRSGPPITVEVDGRTVLTRDDDGVTVEGTVEERSEDRLIFIPGSG